MIYIRKNDIRGYGKGQADKKRQTEAERTQSGLRLTGRSAKPATILRVSEEKIGQDRTGDRDQKAVAHERKQKITIENTEAAKIL